MESDRNDIGTLDLIPDPRMYGECHLDLQILQIASDIIVANSNLPNPLAGA